MGVHVSFILVNYHSEDLTFRCVESIFAQTKDVTFEVIIFDNHSRLNTARFQTRWPDHVRILLSSSNLGFGTACETAARQAQGKYLFFLNNDSELLNDAATQLARFMDRQSDAGLAGGQLIDGEGRRVASFDYFPTLTSKIVGTGLLRKVWPAKYPLKETVYDNPIPVDLVSGADLFVPRALYRSVGGFDSAYFLYCEEEDLALRIRARGKTAYYVPQALVRHAGGGSSRDSGRLKKEFYISFFKFYRKHYGWARTVILKALTFRQFLWRAFNGPDQALWRPILYWFLRGAPESDSLRYEPGNIDGPTA